MISFATPAAAWGLLFAIPLTALFLRRRLPRQRDVSTLMFWDEAIVERTAWKWWWRWRDLWMWFCEMVLLLGIVGAWAEPRWTTANDDERPWIFVLDNSASLRAFDGDDAHTTNRWEQVQRRALTWLARRPRAAPAMILTAGSNPRIAQRWTTDTKTLRDAILQLPCTDGPTRLNETLAWAEQLGSMPKAAQQVVITDRPGLATWQQANANETNPTDPAAPPIAWEIVGQTMANAGFTQWQVRRNPADPAEFYSWMEVLNAGEQSVDARIEISLDEQLLDVIPLSLAPRSRRPHITRHRAAGGGVLSARILPDDSFPLDNRAVAILEPQQPLHVVLVTPGCYFLERVLRAMPWVQLEVVEQLPPKLAPQSICILHRTECTEWPTHRLIVIDPPANMPHLQVGNPLANPTIISQRSDSLWLRHVRLIDVVADGAKELQFSGEIESLAETADATPIIGLARDEEHSILIVNLDPERGDFALRTAFPLLMSQALHQLHGDNDTFHWAFPTGSMIHEVSTKQASTDTTLALVDPFGGRRTVASGTSHWDLGPLDFAGIWRLERATPDVPGVRSSTTTARWASNLADASESTLQVADLTDPKSVVSIPAPPLWPWLVALLISVYLLEWWLFHRRWIGA